MTATPGAGRSLYWLLHRIDATDVHRDPDLRYRAYTGNTNPDGTYEVEDVTDQVEALNLPSCNGNGRWTPPLVRLRGDHVELTTAGEEIRKREARRSGAMSDAARTRKARRAAVPLFQPAAA
jgi:hypothetical protein